MIKSLKIKGFLSHVDTEIDLHPGVNAFVGGNNVGKSAAVVALQTLARNLSGAWMTRPSGEQPRIEVVADDAEVSWERKKSPSYVINGTEYSRAGRGAPPDELQEALRLPEVELPGGGLAEVHFAMQKAPLFLIGENSTGRRSAGFFAATSDVGKLLEMRRLYGKKVDSWKSQRAALDVNLKQAEQSLATLEPLNDLALQLADLDQRHEEIGRREQEADDLERLQVEIAASQGTVERLEHTEKVLQTLTPVPKSIPLGTLANACTTLEAAFSARASLHARQEALENLTDPPVVKEVEGLSTLVGDLADAYQRRERGVAAGNALNDLPAARTPTATADLGRSCRDLGAQRSRCAALHEVADVLASVSAPPVPKETGAMQSQIDMLSSASAQRSERAHSVQKDEDAMARVIARYREFAVEHELCPACGESLDSDRLAARMEEQS